MVRPAFTPQVAARTGVAEEILKTPHLLAVYTGKGGKKSDLETIRDRGLEAQAFNLDQSVAGGVGTGATLNVLRGFVGVQQEYASLMAIVQAVRNDLVDAGADSDAVKRLDQIIANECPLVIRTAITAEGKPARKVSRSASQEAIRSEISKDTGALLGLKAAHAELIARGVSLDRLKKVHDAAESLRGKLSDRTAKKGAAKGVTRSERDAVSAQRARWSSCYRILALAGAANSSIRALLADAAKA